MHSGDLEQVLEREKELSEETARLYAAEILLALEELHRREWLHLNVRTTSVLLDEEGHAVLADPGTSHVGLKDGLCAASHSPEVQHDQGVSKSTDWFCFGALIYELLTGEPPFAHFVR